SIRSACCLLSLRIDMIHEDLEDSLELLIKACSMSLSFPRLVIPAAIYGISIKSPFGTGNTANADLLSARPVFVTAFIISVAMVDHGLLPSLFCHRRAAVPPPRSSKGVPRVTRPQAELDRYLEASQIRERVVDRINNVIGTYNDLMLRIFSECESSLSFSLEELLLLLLLLLLPLTLTVLLLVLYPSPSVIVIVLIGGNITRMRRRHSKVNASNVIILEGILVFHDQDVRDLMNMKIFVDTDADVRLARRIRRDKVERGRDINSVLEQYAKFVKPTFDDFVLPSKKYADVIVPRG
ncbi:hypothetical protein HN51_066069, partial [Arachis hypogaea]